MIISCPICSEELKENEINKHLDESCQWPPKAKNDAKDLPLKKKQKCEPLAEASRPDNLNGFIGQTRLLGPGSVLKSLIESKQIPSIILWGPPGCGKTTLARIIAKYYGGSFQAFSAALHNLPDVKAAVEKMIKRKSFGQKSILFLDEIHRFTKAQQDFFLAPLEAGDLILIAATTENPSFRINSALLSRCKVFVLEKLSKENIQDILKNADEENVVPSDCISMMADIADGDARSALNSLEILLNASKVTQRAPCIEMLQECLQKNHLHYDKDGEEHYNIISALHKSMRGGDPNAALYWLGRMIYAGEDPLYVARRLVRFASEDVGIADPNALPLAVATFRACEMIGMPECDVNLAHCVVYLANAPKSVQAYKAIKNVKSFIETNPSYPVPLHIRNAPTQLMKNLDYGKGYKYNPDFQGPVDQEYMPKELINHKFM